MEAKADAEGAHGIRPTARLAEFVEINPILNLCNKFGTPQNFDR
jgi:hypothetical protein